MTKKALKVIHFAKPGWVISLCNRLLWKPGPMRIDPERITEEEGRVSCFYCRAEIRSEYLRRHENELRMRRSKR